MITTPRFTQRELQLVVEVLEAESRQLPSEIHHTDSRQMRSDLRNRRRTVERLIERLRSDAVEQPAGQPERNGQICQPLMAT